MITTFVSGESPVEFTLNMTDSSSDLEALMANIATTGGALAKKRFMVGEKCLTECDGDIWYRALVTETRDEGYEVCHVTTRTTTLRKNVFSFLYFKKKLSDNLMHDYLMDNIACFNS